MPPANSPTLLERLAGPLTDRLFAPFERLIAPLDLPFVPPPAAKGEEPTSREAMALVWHFARLFSRVLWLVGGLSVVSAVISLAIVWALAFVVDGIVGQGVAGFVSAQSGWLIALVVLYALIDPLVAFIRQTFLSQTVTTLLPAAMRWQGHRAVEGQDLAFFEDVFAGQVASRVAQVVSSVQGQLMTAMLTIPRVVIQFAGSVALLAALAWPLAVPVAVWIVANILFARAVLPIYVARSGRVARARAKATGAMTDVYSNISMVKLFAAEGAENDALRGIIGETIDTSHAENRAYILSDTVVNVMNVIMVVTVFAVSFWGMAEGFVTVGEFVAAATISRGLADSAGAFLSLGQSFTRTLGTVRDAMPVMTHQPSIKDAAGATALAVPAGEIVFDGVSFDYGAATVIDDLSLTIRPGERVGLVGVSGAGKSTLVSLLARLRDVGAGAVRIDGQDVRDVTQASLRRSIGLVSQDVTLLHRSIRDNIAYGTPGADDAAIIAAARRAQAWDFIQAARDNAGREGLDAHVGERGMKLSGGQRQRIAIARVLLKNAPILVLDEATSALDSEAEAAIQSSLDALADGRTTLAIAHRLSTLAAMDRIVVLEAGRIIEEGDHAALLARNGLYARLWNRQSNGFIATKAA